MIRALIGIGVLQFISMLLLLARTKILALTVGVNGVGTISAVDRLTAVVVQTLSLSLPFATIRFLPATLRDSPEQTDRLYRQMRLVMVTLFVPATIVCVGISIVAPAVWGKAFVPYQRTLIPAFLGLLVMALVPFLTNAYAGAVGHTQSMMITIANAAIMVVAAAVAGARSGVDGFYWMYAGLGAAFVAIAASRLRVPGAPRRAGRLSVRDAFRLPAVMWRFAAWLVPQMFVASYSALFVSYTTLRLYGVEATGVLQAAIGVSLSVRTLLGAAHAVFLTPHVNRRAEVAARMEWANEFQRMTGLLFALALPPLLLFPDVALRLLYAPQFLAASAFVMLFVAAEVVTLLSGTYQTLIIADDQMRFHVFQNLAAQALLAGTAAIALPRIGLVGAGLATLSAPVFLFASTLVFLRRRYGVRISAGAARASLVALAILIVAGAIGSRFPGFTGRVLEAKAGACVVIWGLCVWLVPAEDRARLRAGLERLTRRGAETGTPQNEVA